MNNYMLPTDDAFVKDVAKAIAKNRLLGDAKYVAAEALGQFPGAEELLESMFLPIFEKLWEGNGEEDRYQRERYIEDAQAAISVINLKLLTMAE